MVLLSLCIIASAVLYKNEAARILAMIPTPSLSHQVVAYPIVQELARRGHEVVFLTTNPAFAKSEAPKNLTEIDLGEISYSIWRQKLSLLKFDKENFANEGVKAIVEVTPMIFEEQMRSKDVGAVIRSGAFDLILLQAWFRPALVWSHIYRVPVIKVSSMGMLFDNAENVGAPIHPLLYPDTFHQRIYNLSLWETITELRKRYNVENIFRSNEDSENEMIRRLVGVDVPPLRELRRNVQMLFLNENPLWERNRPLPRNVVYFGQIHRKSAKDLPQDIKSFLDGWPQGAVYMSFGTNVSPSHVSARTVQALLRVFARLQYGVLWKWDADQLPGKPDNVFVRKWLPQSDIFRHPNMKLVITQGGLQTIEEAIESGLPLVGLPMLADQWANVEKCVHHGIAVQLDVDALDEERFERALLQVILNDSYRHNVARLRGILNDQPTTPLQRTIQWIEYVLKHKGGSHLAPDAANMSRLEYLEVELFVILLALVLGLIAMVAFSIRRVVQYVESMVTEQSNASK